MGNNSCNHRYWVAIFLSVCLWRCSENPVQENTIPESAIRYVVKVDRMPAAFVRVSVTVARWDHGDSVRFLFPPVYTDNPMLETTGPVCTNIRLENNSGRPIVFSADSLSLGWKKSLSLAFSASALPARLEYDVRFPYVASEHDAEPYVDANSGYLQGNYLFAIPLRHRETAFVWRDAFDFRVDYELGGGIAFYGDPEKGASFRNTYELLFSTAALGGRLLYEGAAGGQAFRLVSLMKGERLGQDLIDTAAYRFNILLADIMAIFGPLSPHPISILFGLVPHGGLEGMHTFNMEHPKYGDSIGNFSMIAAHEILHFWLGLRTGDYEDPWWKEGTAYYLGFLIAKRNGLCTLPFMKSKLLTDSSGQTGDALIYSLSAGSLRDSLFHKRIHGFVYVKGAQVCLLLDRRIREASGGNWTLGTVLNSLVRQFPGKAFYRKEYYNIIENLSGADVSDIFTQYVDRPGAIPDSILQENWDWLRQTGAFGSTGAVILSGLFPHYCNRNYLSIQESGARSQEPE